MIDLNAVSCKRCPNHETEKLIMNSCKSLAGPVSSDVITRAP